MSSSEEENDLIKDREEVEQVLKKFKVNRRLAFPVKVVKETKEEKVEVDVVENYTKVLDEGTERMVICISLPYIDGVGKKQLDTVFKMYSAMLNFRGCKDRTYLVHKSKEENKFFLYMVFLIRVNDLYKELQCYKESIGQMARWSINGLGWKIKTPCEPITLDYPIFDSYVDCRDEWGRKKLPSRIESDLCLVWTPQFQKDECYIHALDQWCSEQ